MTSSVKHVCVCVCTYKRPLLLRSLLEELSRQETRGLFTYSIVVADNDHLESARGPVADFAERSGISVSYEVEPRQNIALTRNKAVASARGDLLAFIDDDELPIREWLLNLFEALHEYDVDGVLGPVKPLFDESAPRWVIEGGFYDRPDLSTGLRLDWRQCRTGNVLLKSELFAGDAQPFRPECRSGEDQDFFRRMIDKGHAFVWCHEALALEVVPPLRWKRRFLVRRALFRGVFSLRNRRASFRPVLESLVAAPLYAVALPFALVLGQRRFMSCVFTLSYHTGRLLALVGINVIGDAYVTE